MSCNLQSIPVLLITFISIFGINGEGFDCGDVAGKWFDEFLGKPGHRLFNGHSELLKRRELKKNGEWRSSVQPTDKVI